MLTEREKLVTMLRLEGYMQREIAEKLGMTQVNVSRTCKKVSELISKLNKNEKIILNTKGRPKRKYERGEQLKIKVRNMHNTGLTYKEISEKLNMSVSSISRYMRAS